MAEKSKIEWTDATWNIVTGCSVVSPGCTNCYAMKLAGTRLRNHPSREGLTVESKAGPVWNGEVRFNEEWLLQPLSWKRPRKIFVAAHGDLFHDNVKEEWLDKIFALMALCPQHVFQVLTKRPKRMREYCAIFDHRRADALGNIVTHMGYDGPLELLRWPLPNVWLGVTAEDQPRADERREYLDALARQGWTTFVSYEPALGAVDWTGWDFVKQIISGGESGPRARPSHPDWFRATRDWCASNGIAYLHKQNGEWHTAAYNISTGNAVFRRFETFQQWVNKASTWVSGGICIDRNGRELKTGADMMRARDEESFPVTIMHRVGKKRAGRLLDGVTHDGFPGVRA